MSYKTSHLRDKILIRIEKQLSRIADALEGERGQGRGQKNRAVESVRTPEAEKVLEIAGALEKLGALSEYIEIVHRGDRAKVHLDGEYFGIYDFVRKTFVD